MASNIPSRGQIYWADLRPGQGSEQDGLRPVLIISNNLMNIKAPFVIVIPMTTSDRSAAGPFNIGYQPSDYISDSRAIGILREQGNHFVHGNGVLLCNQSRAISKERLGLKVGSFTNKAVLAKVKSAIIDSFGVDACEECGFPVRPGAVACGKCRRIHRRKCRKCSNLFDLLYNYCPQCGEGV